jgi:hypothetical protein
MSNKTQQANLSEKARQNLEALSERLQVSGTYFKPEPQHTYILKINPEDKIEEIQNERFAIVDPKTGETRIPTRYEFKITHPNTGAEQLWTTSKMVATRLLSLLNEQYTVLKVKRIGTGKQTTYDIEGVE